MFLLPKSGEEEEPSGLLANYLSDPDHVFVGEDTKAMLMLAHNLTDRRQLAEKRFRCVLAHIVDNFPQKYLKKLSYHYSNLN